MPVPPNVDDFAKVNFVANYFLHGCTPPMHLFVQTAREPAFELGLMFLVPDLTDIGQAVFDPKKGRRRSPGRHGRKKRRFPAFPDPSEMVGQKASGVLNPHNALNFGPINKVFRIWNAYEAVAITAAVLEGITDIGYQGLLGVLTIDPNHCQAFGRLVKHTEIFQTEGGVGPYFQPVQLEVLDTVTGFNQTQWGCSSPFGGFNVHFRIVVRNGRSDITWTGRAALVTGSNEVRGLSRLVTLYPGEQVTLECSGDFEKLEWANWGMAEHNGFCDVLHAECLAFDHVDIPWW